MTRLSADERIARMTFASVYPHYVTKVVRKGRTIEELHIVICWLTGWSAAQLEAQINGNATFVEVFASVRMPEAAQKIRGVICGIRVEEIENSLTQKVRFLDKLVDELARGKRLESIIRN